MHCLIPAALECCLRAKEKNKSESITLDFKGIWNSSECAASFMAANDSSCWVGWGWGEGRSQPQTLQTWRFPQSVSRAKPASWLRTHFQLNQSSPKGSLGLMKLLFFQQERSFLVYFPLIKPNLHNLCRNCILTISSIITHVMPVVLITWQRTGSN